MSLCVQHKATYITLMCKACKNTKILTCKPGMGGAQVQIGPAWVPQECMLPICCLSLPISTLCLCQLPCEAYLAGMNMVLP